MAMSSTRSYLNYDKELAVEESKDNIVNKPFCTDTKAKKLVD